MSRSLRGSAKIKSIEPFVERRVPACITRADVIGGFGRGQAVAREHRICVRPRSSAAPFLFILPRLDTPGKRVE